MATLKLVTPLTPTRRRIVDYPTTCKKRPLVTLYVDTLGNTLTTRAAHYPRAIANALGNALTDHYGLTRSVVIFAPDSDVPVIRILRGPKGVTAAILDMQTHLRLLKEFK